MNLNFTVGIPITVLILAANLVVNFLRFSHLKKNGVEASMLSDLKEGQEKCAECFKELNTSSVKSEVHLSNVVQQLQLMNGKL